jgi:hypothetical protein
MAERITQINADEEGPAVKNPRTSVSFIYGFLGYQPVMKAGGVTGAVASRRQYEVLPPPRLKAVGLLLVVELPHLTQEAQMKEYYIGLDVHKDSVLMAVLDDRKIRSAEKAGSDMIGVTEVPDNSPKLVKAIKDY